MEEALFDNGMHAANRRSSSDEGARRFGGPSVAEGLMTVARWPFRTAAFRYVVAQEASETARNLCKTAGFDW
jgi:hypothetical protein